MPSTATLPSFSSYGNYSSSNYGVNSLCFTDARGIDYFFSYQTLVAVRYMGTTLVRRNDWGPTTGKHLNWIDGGDKASRLSADDFTTAVG
jgi:hypothetical protein